MARRFDPFQREGLFRFLQFINEQEEAEVSHPPAGTTHENAVRVMTIHKAKGLEFDSVAMIGLEVWGSGCGRRQRYVAASGGTWRREGEVVPEDKRPADRSGCRVRWKRGDEGSARDAASSTLGEKKVARVRVPPASLGWAGFAKLRFGEWVESPIENAAGLDGLVMPCAIDAGGEATCAVPWDAVVEVSDCAS
jgi:hypothetical protein